MAFSAGRKQTWDLTHLSTKYPWLRVDADTIAEFRSPFQWVDVPPKPRALPPQQHADQGDDDEVSSDDASEQQSDSEERNESVRFSLSGRQVAVSGSNKKQPHKPKKKRTTKHASERWKKTQQSHPAQKHPANKKPSAAKASEVRVSTSAAANGHSLHENGHKVQENSVPRIPSAGHAGSASQLLTLPESDALYQALRTYPAEKRKKVKKKPHNVLTLRYYTFQRIAHRIAH